MKQTSAGILLLLCGSASAASMEMTNQIQALANSEIDTTLINRFIDLPEGQELAAINTKTSAKDVTVLTTSADQKNSTKEGKLIGRDAQGMFKNHKSFVKLRNIINEQENVHQTMFDQINEKLQDKAFLEQAIQQTEVPPEVEAQEAALSKPLKPEAMALTDEELKCYSSRFSDVTGDARAHYSAIGLDQGRSAACSKNLTRIEAQKYLDRSPLLQHQLGKKGPVSQELAREHFSKKGYKTDGPLTQHENWEQPWFCGNTDLSSCQCKGTLWYGALNAPDTNNTISTFDEMRNWKTISKKSSDWANCNPAEFGADPFPGQRKQCWCEPEPEYMPTHCADDGGDCMCNGHVFFGSKYGESGQTKMAQDFYSMSSGYFTVNDANKTGNVSCSAKSFEDTNPTPGEDQACYCDDDKELYSNEEVQNIKEYWRSLKLEKDARETASRAEAEVHAAEQEASEANTLAAAQEKADAAANQAAQQKAQAEAEAAKAKAEQEAAAAQAAADAKKAKQEAEAAKEAKEAEAKKAEAAAKKAAAEKAEKEAQALKDAAAKKAALEKAEAERQAAIQAAVAAAIAEQKAQHDAELAKIAADQEKERIQQEKAEKELRAAQEADRLAKEAAERQAKEEMEAAKRAAEAEAKKAEAERLQAAMERQIAEAIETQKRVYEERMAKEEAKRAKRRAEKEAREAQEASNRQKEIEAAEEARKRAHEEADKLIRQARAAEDSLRAQKHAEEDEKRRLEKEAYEKQKAEQAAKDALLKAQKAEELAKSEADMRAAREEEARAQKAYEEAEKQRQHALNAKKDLEEDIEKKEAQARIAEQAAAAAAEKQKQAEEDAAHWKALADAAQKKSKADVAKAEALTRRKAEEQKRKQEEQRKRHDEALKAQAATFKKAQEAQRDAHHAAEEARKRLEQKQIAEHQRQMAARRNSFEKQFRNVWATGPTGVSIATYTVSDRATADELVTRLFYNTLIADVEEYVNHGATRAFLKHNHMIVEQKETQIKLEMVTSDDRIAELIEEVAVNQPNGAYPDFDLVVTPLATGNKEYLQWVKEQTLKKDPNVAFFNIRPEAAIQALDNPIADIQHVQVESETEDDDEEEEE